MLNISKALSSSQAQTYHKLEFTSEAANYYKQDGAVAGEWQGQLAAKMGLSGTVTPEEFARLTEGLHPQTGEPMVKHREAQEYTNADGSTTKAVEHRAGWDATFSAPKSVSLTALVGGDERVREAHREAVTAALTELERYTQARIGGNNPAETTGQFIAAKFEHDTARPVDGYAAPQLHTHAVIFNVTERPDGSTRALQPQSLFDSQNFATAVYQSALTYQLRNLGYEIEPGKSGAPEIKGYSQEYLDASSPRSQQIKDHLERTGQSGAEAAQIAAHATRDSKQILTPEQVLAAHREIAESFGNEAATVVAEARERAQKRFQNPAAQPDETARESIRAREAVTYARSSNFEREAVVDERALMRDALRHGMGETTYPQIRAEFESRRSRGDFVRIEGEKYDSGRKFTTPETIASERANVAHVMRGQQLVDPLMDEEHAAAQASRKTFLNSSQRAAIQEVLTSPDRIHGLQGLAGTGKTTVLSSIREGAESAGYSVVGFAPSSRAAAQLRDAGIAATTLQSFLARGNQGQAADDPASQHLYLLDESSLASTKQMRAFLDKIQPQDRILVIGDTRQHQGVDAGRPFEQMQDAGMRTSRLDQIMRQKDPELLKAVELLATGKTVEGVRLLGEQGRVTEVKDGNERVRAIAKDYVANPENTIVVSPDNRSRQAINQAIRTELQAAGSLATDDREFRILAHRSDMTGADREWAARYQPGDILKYTSGSKLYGIDRDTTARVVSVQARDNTLTVEREDGQAVTYDPKRLRGANVYREITREFATGDRVQFTAADKTLAVNNRDLGTIIRLDDAEVTVRMDGKEGRVVSFDPAKMRHFDHGYAVTSHSSQGLTEGRVIANIDTNSSRSLINTRLAYVAISRASDDARIYTNDAETLGTRLATETSKTAAIDFRQNTAEAKHAASPVTTNQYADPNHRIAAVALAYSERPDSTVVVAPDRGERRELNQLIRSDLQSQGRVAPDSVALIVHAEKTLSNPRIAAQYAPGDVIQYRQASPTIDGIPHNSIATVLSVDARNNTLTVQTPGGDVATYDPHLSKTMTAESAVFRQEQREIAKGDRVQFTRTDADLGIRRDELGTVTAIDPSNLEVRLDKGSLVKVTADQARHIEHGYAIESVKAGAPERVLFTHDTPPVDREIAVLSRKDREVNLYISDSPAVRNQETQVRESPRHPPPAPAETPSQAVPNHKFQSTAASLELQRFEKYHDAVQAERYRVTSIKMLPDGQNKIFILDKDKQTGVTRGFTPEEIAQRIPEMQRLQRRGENIYYTPLSDNKHHILIDDMNRPKFAKLIADGHRPAALIESSPGNYQAILTLPKLGTAFDREVANRLTVELNREYGDPKLSGAIHPHRAPGFENRKPKHMREDGSYPEVRLLKAERREDGKALEMTRAIDADYTQRAEKHGREAGQRHAAVASGQANDLSQVYDVHRNDILTRQKGDIDYSRLDSMIALRMRATHHDRSDIQAAILDGAPRSRPVDANHNHQWEYYAQRTADSAYTPQADKQLESLAKYGKHWARLEARGSQDDNSQRNQQFEPAALSPAPSATTGNSDAALMPPERVSHRPRIRH